MIFPALQYRLDRISIGQMLLEPSDGFLSVVVLVIVPRKEGGLCVHANDSGQRRF